MPFLSRRQQRWAFATGQPFAKRWARETPDFAALPEKKDAGTDAGAPVHGPGGLLGTPGLRSQRRARRAVSVTTKPMTRSEAARAAALARWGKYTPRAKPPKRLGGAAIAPLKLAKIKPLKGGPKGGKGRRSAGKPKPTDAERQAAQQAKRQEREQQRAAEQAQNRKAVDKALGLPEDAAGALDDLRAGKAVDDDGGLVKLGLAEQARDGSYRLTPAGRALDEARKAGDAGRARDIMSRARDTLTARGERQAATAARRQATAARRAAAAAERERRRIKPKRSGGSSRAPKPISAARSRRLERARKQIADAVARVRRGPRRIVQTAKSFTVFKDHTGAYRWVMRTTTAYRDRDGEILTVAGLERDAARMTATKQFGPLRYWHIGEPDPFDPVAPWGPGLDIGDCDYSIVIGRTSIESGTFKSQAIGKAFAGSADDYEASPGFFHPYGIYGPLDGCYEEFRRFERSTVPVKFGRASNLFTGMSVKEARMDQATYDQRVKAFLSDMNAKGVPPDVAAATLGQMQQADKSAKTTPDPVTGQPGVAFKSDDAPQVFTAPDGTQGIIHEGRFVALKAMPPEFAEEEKADIIDQEGAPVDDMAEMMDDASFISAIADAVVAKIAPMFGDMKMSEFKTLLGGMAQKEAGTLARIAQLEAELATLKGDRPALTALTDVAAALKSTGPQAPPDGSEPQIPADATPVQRLAIQTMPALYQNTPQGAFQGWLPPTQLPPQQS